MNDESVVTWSKKDPLPPDAALPSSPLHGFLYVHQKYSHPIKPRELLPLETIKSKVSQTVSMSKYVPKRPLESVGARAGGRDKLSVVNYSRKAEGWSGVAVSPRLAGPTVPSLAKWR